MITPPADVHPRPLGCISNESPFSYHKHSCLLQIMESNESCHMFRSERISNPSHMVERPWFGLVWSSLCGPQLTRGTRRSRGKCMDADRESTVRTPQGVLLITMHGCVATWARDSCRLSVSPSRILQGASSLPNDDAVRFEPATTVGWVARPERQFSLFRKWKVFLQ